MIRLSIVLCLLTFLTAVVLRKLLAKSVVVNEVEMQLSTHALLKKISPYATQTVSGKNYAFKENTLLIPKEVEQSKLITDHAPALLSLGLTMLGGGSNVWIKRIQSMNTFDQIFFPFTLIICTFGILARTISPTLAITILTSALTLNCLNNFYQTWVKRLAMNLAIERTAKVQLYSKRETAQRVEDYLSSYAFYRIIPFSLKWIL